MKSLGILLIGGRGLRFGRETPKQYQILGDKELYLHALTTFKQSNLFDDILIISPDHHGGPTRQASVYNALKLCPLDTDIVLIHDGVRPFVTIEILEKNIKAAAAHGAADTVAPCTDTIIETSNGQTVDAIPNRSALRRGQTPQTFRFNLIQEAHHRALADGITDASDDCQLVHRLGHPIHLIEGSEENIKITTPQDLLLAELLLQKKGAHQR